MRVLEIDENSIDSVDKSILNDGKNECFVKVYMPWCGFCKQMEGEWNEMGNKAGNLEQDNVYILSIHGDHIKTLNPKFDVSGYPTIVYLNKDGTIKSKYGGERKSENMFDFLLEQSNYKLNGGSKRKRSKRKRKKSIKRKTKKGKSKKKRKRYNKKY